MADNNGSNWKESGIIEVSSSGDTQFLCYTTDRAQRRFFNLSVTLEDSIHYLTLEEQRRDETSIQIKNHLTDVDLNVAQAGFSGMSFTIKRDTYSPFAWFNPVSGNKMFVNIISDGELSTELTIDIALINRQQKGKVYFKNKSYDLYYGVFLHGNQRVVKFSKSPFEEERPVSKMLFILSASIKQIGISIISSLETTKSELAYLGISPFNFEMNRQRGITSFVFRTENLQLENNTLEPMSYPVVVFPEQDPKPGEPFIEVYCEVQDKKNPRDVISWYNFCKDRFLS